jgi:hypothetical protein
MSYVNVTDLDGPCEGPHCDQQVTNVVTQEVDEVLSPEMIRTRAIIWFVCSDHISWAEDEARSMVVVH